MQSRPKGDELHQHLLCSKKSSLILNPSYLWAASISWSAWEASLGEARLVIMQLNKPYSNGLYQIPHLLFLTIVRNIWSELLQHEELGNPQKHHHLCQTSR